MAMRRGNNIGQQPGIVAYEGSFIDMYGGSVTGRISLYNSHLVIHGSELAYNGNFLSGKYLDGTPFSHTIESYNGTVLFNVPEPTATTLVSLLLAIIGVAFAGPRGWRAVR